MLNSALSIILRITHLPGSLVGRQRLGDIFRVSDGRKVGQEGGDARTAVGSRASKAYQEKEEEEEEEREQVGKYPVVSMNTAVIFCLLVRSRSHHNDHGTDGST